MSGVTLKWRILHGKSGERQFLVLLDRRENTSLAEVRRTLQYESCHVFVDWREKEEHGPMFQECMRRFGPEN